jgi:DNA-3-methyladenine glycosylase II
VRFTLEVTRPFRLDRTVAVLQRLPSAPVDVWAGGAYLRAFETPDGPIVWRVEQESPGSGAARLAPARLTVELDGPTQGAGPWAAQLRRMLGLDVSLAPFFALARGIPELAPLARLALGLRPPRFAALHEAFASVILFQQVSLASAMATLRRLVAALSPAIEARGAVLHPFPPAATMAAAPDDVLRAAGISGAKGRALRAVAEAVASGALRDADLEPLSTEALVERLEALEGVGAWTASLLALRYFGRLDVFPPGDVAALKALGAVGGGALAERLGPWRGMLYYLLFVRRMAIARAPAWLDARLAGA